MKKSISLLALLPLLLTSCGQKISSVPAYINGDLYYEESITVDNAFRTADINTITNLINSKESFILYTKEASCYACSLTTPRLVKYVASTKQVVYAIDAETQKEDFKEFAALYHDDFYPDNQILFPTIFVYSKNTGALNIPYSRYDGDTMLCNAIKDYVVDTKVYSFNKFASFSTFINDKKTFKAVLYDRDDDDYANAYHLHVEETSNSLNKDVAVLNIAEWSEADKVSLLTVLGVGELGKLTLYKFENKEKTASLHVTNNHDEAVQFLTD